VNDIGYHITKVLSKAIVLIGFMLARGVGWYQDQL